jgi:hypothetical protein
MANEAELINRYNAEAEKARKELSENRKIPITAFQIQVALGEYFQLKDSCELIFKNLPAAQIIDILRGYAFLEDVRPVKVVEIHLDESILPNKIIIALEEAKIKFKGERWFVHKYDKDTVFPSNPHAHNYETKLKMHLGTGALYGYEKQFRGRIKEKDLVKLRDIICQRMPDLLLPPLAVD